MPKVIVKALKNGPYEISADAKVVDDSGKEYADSAMEPIYLCRCGASKTKPFCDSSHRAIGFKAEETAG